MTATFIPDWTEKAPKEGSFRSIFKYGAPNKFKHPSHGWYKMLKDDFALTDADFTTKHAEGLEQVSLEKLKHPQTLPSLYPTQITTLKTIVGEDNIALDDYSRVKYAYGKTAEEMMELRIAIVREVPDAVVHPRNKLEVQKIVEYCNQEKIPLYLFGGGSSVTLGCRPGPRRGITLVMATHMNKLLSINETNQTATVQAGMLGSAYEECLNKRNYSGGHFPQSFECATVGGWVVTLGSGQASTYYGDAYDLVLSQEYVTPVGTFRTLDYPATATGPKVNDIMKGSEGTYGVLVEVTMKIFRSSPANHRRFSFMFPSWEAAVDSSREVMQAGIGRPAIFRISDPEETDRGLKLYGIPSFLDKFMQWKGLLPMKRCLCLGSAEGEADFNQLLKSKIKKIARQHGALYLSEYPTKKWEKTRYQEPYMREDLGDYGIVIDTLEAAVTWDNLHKLHQGVRTFIKSRARTMCMTHASHFYPQGTNLYFIFITPMSDPEEYRKFQRGIIESIHQHGGSLSHHHGIGRMLAPWSEKHLGKEQMAILRTLKQHFDPNNIMNPGVFYEL
ncbi:MAG: FAD-binding oxidoreductase [Oligoflexia bacterium]|nr:FAD-binding oxidoreductase [Oligoflexia bacterium]